jgi:hypothetical protein
MFPDHVEAADQADVLLLFHLSLLQLLEENPLGSSILHESEGKTID